MKITETTNGTTNLNVNSNELDFLQALIAECGLVPNPCPSKKRPAALVPGQMHGFTAGALNHEDVDAMAAALKDWREFIRLRDKFVREPKFKESAARVNHTFSQSSPKLLVKAD